MTENNRPHQALELIDKIQGHFTPPERARREACPEERFVASKKMAELQSAAKQATPAHAEAIKAQKAWANV